MFRFRAESPLSRNETVTRCEDANRTVAGEFLGAFWIADGIKTSSKTAISREEPRTMKRSRIRTSTDLKHSVLYAANPVPAPGPRHHYFHHGRAPTRPPSA